MTLEKAQFVVEATGQKIRVSYNPTTINDNFSALYDGEGTNLQFNRVVRDDFVVKLFFDTYEQNTDVRQQTTAIAKLMQPSQGSGQRKEPPVLLFNWQKTWFRGVMIQITQNFTMFSSQGFPVRAWLTVTLKSAESAQTDLEMLGYPNCRRLWLVRQNDRLDLIAQKALGNPAYWRLVAQSNQIEDPLTFPKQKDIGRKLVIPDIHNTKAQKVIHGPTPKYRDL